MTNDEKMDFLKKGVLISDIVPREVLESLTRKFAPMKTEHELIRIGPNFDGGYLVPSDLNGISTCFSPGVSTSSHFEADLLKYYGIKSHLADFSVEGPPHGFQPLSFTKKFLGSHNDEIFMTLEKWVQNSWEYDMNSDFILQMDIEGAEYDSLLATPDYLLKKFRIIILEIHGLENWGFPAYYKIANALISKLTQHFIVVHNHPNNCSGTFSMNGVDLPSTIEITLLRKDRCKFIEPASSIPHILDFPCCSHMPEVILSKSLQASF